MRRTRILLGALVLAALAAGAHAQSSRDAERRLERVKRELDSVAAERRRLEGQRGEASLQLRQADEQVGKRNRALRATESALDQDRQALAALQQRRAALQGTLAARRRELENLLRAAYAVGEGAPLQALLAHDDVVEGQHALAYHGYLQRDRAQRIRTLTAELRELDALEQEIADRRSALDATHRAQRAQLAELEQARRERAGLVAQLERRYRDRAGREQALGRDARALQQLLQRLRTAAAKAAAQRATTPKPKPGATPPRPSRTQVASAAPLTVGGLGWPVAGQLLAGYGGALPDGRTSEGVLIGAPAGSTVKAVADGRVVFADWMNGYGLILIVDHGNGYMSLYAHNDALLRDAGATVRRGDALATVGNSGAQGRPALYFELRKDGRPVDPRAWLQRR